MRRKILTVVGARPQFIKASVISRLIEGEYNEDFQEVLVHTGQHYDNNMSEIFFEELKIKKPNHKLVLNTKTDVSQVSKIIFLLEQVIIKEDPDFILTYGDTNSTLAAALTASKMSIKLIHIEAGLRSYRYGMQEEINRVVTDKLSQFLFCPNKEAVVNLRKEGIVDNVFNTGDIMLDSFNYFTLKNSKFNVLKNNLSYNDYFFVTVHRAENVDNIDRLHKIISALNFLALNTKIIFSIHPRTKKNLNKFNIKVSPKINCIEPQPYLSVINYIFNCFAVITDSGGLQKEAYFANKPCITLRDETEWKETVNLGLNKIFKPDELEFSKDIISKSILEMPTNFPQIFGDGNCGRKILEILKK